MYVYLCLNLYSFMWEPCPNREITMHEENKYVQRHVNKTTDQFRKLSSHQCFLGTVV